jgi:hypothetical protein
VNSHDPGPLLPTSAVRHSEEGQRVEGVLIRAADAEFDVPGEPHGSYTRIECCRRETSERREHIDTVVVRNQHQLVVPERHVMATVHENVEGELSRRLWIDDEVPRAGDNGPEIRRFFAVTVERAGSERAMVGLFGRGRRRTRRGHEDGERSDDVSQDFFSAFHNMVFFLCFRFVAVVLGNPETQTVSHSFPKLCAALQRKFGRDAAHRAVAAMFGLVSRERITTNDTALGSAQVMRRSTPNREGARLLGITHRTQTTSGATRRRSGVTFLIVRYPEVGQRLVGAEGTVVVEVDVPPESRRCRIRVERHRHLRSEGVSVNAILERDGR